MFSEHLLHARHRAKYFTRMDSFRSGKGSTCNAGDLGSIPGLGRSPGEGSGYPLQYSGLENSMACIVHGVAKGWTRLSDFHFFSLSFSTDNIHMKYKTIIVPILQSNKLRFGEIK